MRLVHEYGFTGASLRTDQPFDVAGFAAKYGGAATTRLKSGTVIYAQGEPADALYHLMAGAVQIAVVSNQGKEGILGVLEPGSFWGESCLLGNRTRVATATCLADCTVARFERSSVVHAIRSDPAIAEFFLSFLLTSNIKLRESLISQLFDSSERRLAWALLRLANYGKEPASPIRNVDQEALAHMIGTTRSRVNHFMNKFRRLHYIDYDGRAIVVSDALQEFALGRGTADDALEEPLAAP